MRRAPSITSMIRLSLRMVPTPIFDFLTSPIHCCQKLYACSMLIGVKDSEGDDCSGVRADCVSRLFVGSLAIIESASTPKTTFEDLRDASYAVDVEYAAALLSGPAL